MLSAGSARRGVRQRRPDRVEREIGHNAEPADERVAGTEAGSAEAVGQRLGLEVDRRPHELRRRGYPECVEARALPLLSRGMVDLEHAHIPGLTHANVSRPAPRITYWPAPGAASQSSLNRERAATHVASSGALSPNTVRDRTVIDSASGPTKGHASQSARRARGPWATRCAPRAHAVIIAVRLARPVSEIPERCIVANPSPRRRQSYTELPAPGAALAP
jgi:hypothetical protein